MFGWDKEVQQALQCISMVTFLNGAKELAENSRSGSLKWREKRRQGALNGPVQRGRVLIWRERGLFVRFNNCILCMKKYPGLHNMIYDTAVIVHYP